MIEANKAIINEGFEMLGITELSGLNQNNPVIVKWIQEFIPWAKHDEINWCGVSLYECAKKAGCEIKREKALQVARNWRNEGVKVEKPKPGDIAVLWSVDRFRSWKGHVGIYLNDREGKVWLMGGNQSNQWNVKAYPGRRVLEYRRLNLKPLTV